MHVAVQTEKRKRCKVIRERWIQEPCRIRVHIKRGASAGAIRVGTEVLPIIAAVQWLQRYVDTQKNAVQIPSKGAQLVQ